MRDDCAAAAAISTSPPSRTARPATRWLALLHASTCLATLCSAANTGYKYDALGRLREVTHDNGNLTTYTLDAAGNRMQVTESSSEAAPASISVPLSSITGNYSISWTGGGTVTAYELWEATNGSFTGETRVFLGAGTAHSIVGHGNGTFYYRVRGCNGTACTEYRAGANGVAVTLPPEIPPSISVPSASNSGNYTVSWTAPGGTLTGYQLYEATNANFSGEAQVPLDDLLFKNFSAKPNGTYYYRVMACNGPGCSAPQVGINPVVVARTPGQPPSITVPTVADYDGVYSVTWGQSTEEVSRYELQESTNATFTSPTLVHNIATRQFDVTNKGTGTYYYRVRACYSTACSNYLVAPSMRVVRAPSVTGALVIPASATIGNYFVNWGAATGTVTSYQLREATNAAFTSDVQVHDGARGANITGRANGTYYYRVRACNEGNCSDYVNGTNPIVISSPIPPQPSSVGIQKWPDSQCSWFVSWSPSSGATYYIVRDMSGKVEVPTWDATPQKSYSFCGVQDYSGDPLHYKPKWIKACNASGCSLPTNVPWP